MNKKRILAIMLVFILFLTACQAAPPKQEDKGGEKGNQIENQEAQGDSSVKNIIAPEEAWDIFMKKYPEAKIKQIELDKENTSNQYKIEGVIGQKEYELKIDAYTGEIIKSKEEVDDDQPKIKQWIKREGLDQIDAFVNKALEWTKEEKNDAYELWEWELEAETSYLKLEIELKNEAGQKIKFKYNLDTGELLERYEK